MAKPKYNQRFWVDIEVAGVQAAIALVAGSISPVQLGMFLHGFVWPHFRDRIVDRFAYEGDSASGPWPPLSPATIEIKESLGYYDQADYANIRTGAMFEYVKNSKTVAPNGLGAVLRFPEEPNDPIMRRKLRVAQAGDPGPNWLNPAMGETPPRPVIAMDGTDLVEVIARLQRWIVLYVGTKGTVSVPVP